MLIDDVVEFCDEEYNSKTCIRCNLKMRCGNESCGCQNCLDDIHFHRNKLRTSYDCEKLMDFYVCKYSYKYCSEILYVLEECIDLSKYPFFNILSLGCGAAPDLMAFDYLDCEQDISYYGIDMNNYLEKIHNFIEDNFWGGTATFVRGVDVLTFFEKTPFKDCNILIIQYLISFFYNHIGKRGLQKWFFQIANNIVKYKPNNSPMLIIINDNDSCYTGRDDALLLTNEIKKLGFEVSEQRMRFGDEDHYRSSRQYKSCNNYFEIPNYIKNNYSTAIKCGSAQLILEVY